MKMVVKLQKWFGWKALACLTSIWGRTNLGVLEMRSPCLRLWVRD